MPADMPMMAGEGSEPMMNQGEEGGEPTSDESSETTSVFIPKDALGGRKCKPGEKLTLTVNDVDPDTGEVEATVEGYKAEKKMGRSTSDAIDAMPENE